MTYPKDPQFRGRHDWFGRSEVVFLEWHTEGKLLPCSYLITDISEAIYIREYLKWLFRLTHDHLDLFYKKLNSGELQIDWLFGDNAYTLYRAMYARRMADEQQ